MRVTVEHVSKFGDDRRNDRPPRSGDEEKVRLEEVQIRMVCAAAWSAGWSCNSRQIPVRCRVDAGCSAAPTAAQLVRIYRCCYRAHSRPARCPMETGTPWRGSSREFLRPLCLTWEHPLRQGVPGQLDRPAGSRPPASPVPTPTQTTTRTDSTKSEIQHHGHIGVARNFQEGHSDPWMANASLPSRVLGRKK